MAFDYSTIDLEGMLARSYEVMSPSQRAGVGHARKYGRHIFRARMGLGKTFEMLTCVLCYKPQVCLIIVSGKNAVNTWRQQLKQWYPELGDDKLFNLVRGTAAQRKALYRRRDCIFYAVTMGSFIRDVDWLISVGFRPSCVVIDEPHKSGLRNRKSLGFLAVKAITAPTYNGALKFIGMCCGTLTSKGVPQLWSYLHIMDPKLFRGYWPFIERYCNVINGPFGREIGRPKNTDGLALAMAPYIYTVPEDVANNELPPIRRVKLLCELSPQIAKIYNTLSQELYYELSDGQVHSVGSVLGTLVKLRQLIACPAIIDPSLGVGDPIEVVCEKILELKDEIPNWSHNIVFSPFVDAIPYYRNYCSAELGIPLDKILVLKGGDEPEEVDRVERIFRADPKSMVICSLLYAQSFNLETALNMYFPHFDWDPDNNDQAEGRGRRRTSDKTRTIMSYYVSAVGTITEDMISILDGKVVVNKQTYEGVPKLIARLAQKLGDQ